MSPWVTVLITAAFACVSCDSTGAGTGSATDTVEPPAPPVDAVVASVQTDPAATDRLDATPIVSSGSSTRQAMLIVCGPSCDGLGMFGVVHILVSDGYSDVVVHVPSPYTVDASWALGKFERRDDQTVVAPAPPPGCHRASIIVNGIDKSDWEYAITVLGDANSDCG
jgi:hypothetical protein